MHCPRCQILINQERVIGATAYCGCGWHGAADQRREGRKRSLRRWASRGILVLSLGLAGFVFMELRKSGFQYSNGVVVRAKGLLGLASAADWENLGAVCLRVLDLECAEEALQKVMDLEPGNLPAKAALAQARTRLGKHDSARAGFEEIFLLGEADPTTLAYYAESLLGLGREKEAESYFYRALSAKPNLIRAAEQLVDLLVQRQAHTEALSLIASVSAGQPTMERFFKARAMAIHDVAQRDGGRPVDEVRLASIDRHHYLPIALERGGPTDDFLVDTGASSLTLNESYLTSQRGVEFRVVRRTMVGLANGDFIPATVLVFKKIYVGPWVLHDVEALVCAGCQLLAGKSLLRRFKTSTFAESGAEYLVLKR